MSKKNRVSYRDIDRQIQELNIAKSLQLDADLRSNSVGDILKAQNYLMELEKQKPSKVKPKSFAFMPDDTGYTGNGYKESYRDVSFQQAKRISKLFMVQLILQTRKDQVKNYLSFTTDEQKEGFTITKKRGLFDTEVGELSKDEQKEVTRIVKFIESCGNNSKWDNVDTFMEFISKILGDSMIYDQLAFECVRSNNGELQKIIACDASMFRYLDSTDPRYQDRFKDMIWNGHYPRYCQTHMGRILTNPISGEQAIFYPWELGWGIRNKISDVERNGYGISEIEIGVKLITWILWSFDYNGNFFKQGSQPRGFLNIKDGGLDNTTLNEFKQMWRDTMVGSHNCLSGDTFVVTPEGKIRFKDFFTDNSDDKSTKIWTGKKFENALVYKSGKKVLNRITLNNGMSIDSSPEHRFKTVDESGNIVWKKRKDLKVGDFLMINKKSVESKDILYYKDVEVESDLFELIGWMIGDGWIGEDLPKKRRASLFYHQSVEKFIQKYHSWILSKYNINSISTENIRTEDEIESTKLRYGFKNVAGSTLRTDIVDSEFLSFLYELGFTSSKDGKTIPNFMFSCNQKYRRAFLRGFFSADAHVSGGRYIQMAIVFDNLRQQTKELLLMEGIRCCNHEGLERTTSLNKKPKEGYRLLIKDNDIFFSKIGLMQEHKQFKNDEFKYYSVKESFPVELCKKEIADIKADIKLNYKDNKISLCNRKITDGISAALTDKEVFTFNRFKYIYDILEKRFYKYKINPEILDFHFEKIIKLEEFDEQIEMFDVQIFDNENQFMANGILSHNSHKLPVFEGINMEWHDLQNSNKEMEFQKWIEFLLVIFCSLYRIDPSELGFNFQTASTIFGQDGQKERLDHSKTKGLKPLLVFLEGVINKYIVSELNPEYHFKFCGIDIEDEDSQIELDDKKLKAGAVSFESIFEKWSGRKFNPKTDTILNQVFQQAQQAKQMGNPEFNKMVDDEAGVEGEGEQNPFAEFGKSGNLDPITKASIDKINSLFEK